MKNENHAGHKHHNLGSPFPPRKTAQAFYKALSGAYKPVMCDYIVDELHRKFREKFPERLTELEAFLFDALQYIHLVPAPENNQRLKI